MEKGNQDGNKNMLVQCLRMQFPLNSIKINKLYKKLNYNTLPIY